MGDVSKEEFDLAAGDVERLRMQLVACGVVALSNTPESAASARDMHPEYMSASCADVMRAVDREMALRAELEACRKDAERWRFAREIFTAGDISIKSAYRKWKDFRPEFSSAVRDLADQAIDAAMKEGGV